MPLRRHIHSLSVLRIHHNRGNLLRIAQSQMRPGFARIGGFIDSVADRQIRPLQTFSAAHINHVRIRRRHGNRPHRPTASRIVKNRRPGIPGVGGLPHAAIHRRHIKKIWLSLHTAYCHRPPSAEWPNASPLQLLKKFLVIALRIRRNASQPHHCQCQPQLPHRT